MDRENPIAYKAMFKHIFKLVEEVIGRPVHFHYLHQEGIRAIACDMDYSQMEG